MDVALDGLALGNRGGTGRVVEMFLDGFAKILDGHDHVHVFVRKDCHLRDAWRDCPYLHLSEAPFSTGDSLLASARAALRRKGPMRRWLHGIERDGRRLDIVHGPSFVLPPLPAHAVGVVTIHDLAFRLYPETVPFLRRWYLRREVLDAIQRAGLILVDCDAVGQELRDIYSSSLPIRSVPLGVPETPTAPTDPQALRRELGLGERYWMTLSTLEPRKNLVRLVEAYVRALEEADLPDLVLVGRRGWHCGALDAVTGNPELARKIRFPGFLPEEKRLALLDGAELFLAPSIYEGFDLPALEAQSRGVPVLASDIPPHHSYQLDLFRVVNPYDVSTWASALRECALSAPPRSVPRTSPGPADVAFSLLEAYRAALAIATPSTIEG